MKVHDNKIVLWGMSCVGKTYFSKQFENHRKICFDRLFPWSSIEGLGLSTTQALLEVSNHCETYGGHKFILDGWNLGDSEGKYFPSESTVYILYAPYEQIINQYRVCVDDFNQHKPMFKKWYLNSFAFPVRYFRNDVKEFIETDENEYKRIIAV